MVILALRKMTESAGLPYSALSSYPIHGNPPGRWPCIGPRRSQCPSGKGGDREGENAEMSDTRGIASKRRMDRYWKANIRTVIGFPGGSGFLVSYGCGILFADGLNAIQIGGFPWASGSPAGIDRRVPAAHRSSYAWRMNRLDPRIPTSTSADAPAGTPHLWNSKPSPIWLSVRPFAVYHFGIAFWGQRHGAIFWGGGGGGGPGRVLTLAGKGVHSGRQRLGPRRRTGCRPPRRFISMAGLIALLGYAARST